MKTGKKRCPQNRYPLLYARAVVLLLLALFWAPLRSAFCLPDGAAANGTISAFELSRLIEISTRLGVLNESLKNELESSRQNSQTLSDTLRASKTEVERLKAELETLRTTSIKLASTAENSKRTSQELEKALKLAESSLQNWEVSFKAYRLEAETALSRLERSRGRWRIIAGIAAVCALSGWSALTVTTF